MSNKISAELASERLGFPLSPGQLQKLSRLHSTHEVGIRNFTHRLRSRGRLVTEEAIRGLLEESERMSQQRHRPRNRKERKHSLPARHTRSSRHIAFAGH